MKSELFKFSVVRNPQKISIQELGLRTINVISESKEHYKFYLKLIELNKKSPERDEFIDLAKTLMKSRQFLTDVSKKLSGFAELIEWVFLIKEYSLKEFKKKINVYSKNDLKALIKARSFKELKYVTSDSLIITSIVNPKKNGLRSELQNALKMIHILEYVASNPEISLSNLNKMLNATILLPNDLFPLPDKFKERELEINKSLAKKEYNIKKLEKEINLDFEQLNFYNIAMEEIVDLVKYNKLSRSLEDANAITNKDVEILNREIIKNLSPKTKHIVTNELKLNDKNFDIDIAVNQLKSKMSKAQGKLQLSLHRFDGFNEAFDGPDEFQMVFPVIGECVKIEIKPKKANNNFIAKTRGKVNTLGVQDLLIVEQETFKYEVGDIAHIENILIGESKRKNHKTSNSTDTTTFTEEETSNIESTENQVTERNELDSSVSKTLMSEQSLEVGVTASYDNQVVKVETNGNYASNNSLSRSNESSSSFAKDIINKSVKDYKNTLLTSKRVRTIVKEEITNKHKLDNTGGEEHVSGVYKWVNKIIKAQVMNYGKRAMVEFMIPEPAAFYHFSKEQKNISKLNLDKPVRPGFCFKQKFTPLKPKDINRTNYIYFVSYYQVEDISAPPENLIVRESVLTLNYTPKDNYVSSSDKVETINIPSGYQAKSAHYNLAAGRGHKSSGASGNNAANIQIRVVLGQHLILSKEFNNQDNTNNQFDDSLSYDKSSNIALKLNNEEGDFRIAGGYSSDLSLLVLMSVSIMCVLKHELYEEWQIETYNAIMTAYEEQKNEYESGLYDNEFVPGVDIQGNNPLENRNIEKTELKKSSISVLTGQTYDGFNAITNNYNDNLGYPEIDLTDAAREGDFVQFFEQAMEWTKITYNFYDYFWGRKEKWIDRINISESDHLFKKFLQSGYARVWVPIRKGYEEVVCNYINLGGEPWNELESPQCNTENEVSTVSIIQEIKEALGNDFIERPGSITVQDGSKTVTGIDTAFTIDDIDKEILIDFVIYRIESVISDTEIRLSESFTGDDTKSYGITLGSKFVGQPWLVEMPTNLVTLKEKM